MENFAMGTKKDRNDKAGKDAESKTPVATPVVTPVAAAAKEPVKAAAAVAPAAPVAAATATAVAPALAEAGEEAVKALGLLNDVRALATLQAVVRNADGFYLENVRRRAEEVAKRLGTK